MSNGLRNGSRLTSLSGVRIKDGRLDSKEWNGRRASLCLDSSRERGNYNRSGFGLPEGVDNCTLLATDVFVVPMPSFGIDGFPNTSQNTKAAEIVAFDVVCAESTKKADSCGGGVELCELVLLHCLPVTRGCGVYGRGFEHGRRDTVGKRPINDVGVASDPTNISHTSKIVIWMKIKDVFDRQSSTQQVSTSGVNDSLGFSG